MKKRFTKCFILLSMLFPTLASVSAENIMVTATTFETSDWNATTINLLSDDGDYATSSIPGNGDVDFTIGGFDLSSIPFGSRIDSVRLVIIRQAGKNNKIKDNTVQIVLDGYSSLNQSSGLSWKNGIDETVTFGGVASVWGSTLTSSNISDIKFYIKTDNINNKSVVASIDQIKVTVVYTPPPVAICKDDTLYLNATGAYVLSPSEMDNGSYSPQGNSLTLSIDKTNFDCDDVGGGIVPSTSDDYSVSVDLVVVGVNPLGSGCTWGYNYTLDVAYNVSISGTSPPASLWTLQGNVEYEGNSLFIDIDNAGGVDTVTTSQSWTNKTDCETITPETLGDYYFSVTLNGTDLPNQTVDVSSSSGGVTLTVTDDLSGLSSACSANVTVLDTISPWPTENPSDILIPAAQYDPIDPDFADNCSLDKVTWEMTGATTASSPSSGINYVGSTTFNEGATTITYTATDASGNVTTYSFEVDFGRLQYLTPVQTGLGYGVCLIQSPADLIYFSKSTSSFYWNKNICQVADIDFDTDNDADFSDELWGDVYDGTTIAGGDWNMSGSVNSSDDDGFNMIGNSPPFTGVYRGASWDGSTLTLNVDHSVGSLFLERGYASGMFSKAADSAYIKNIHLLDADISTTVNLSGALIGKVDGDFNSLKLQVIVEDCSSSGRVSGSKNEMGGLIGYATYVVVKNCSSSCVVINTGSVASVGGLVGKLNGSKAEITNCSASGDVYAEYAEQVGGLVGYLTYDCSVEGSYATGHVQGDKSAGGFVGSSKRGIIKNCYSTGAVKGAEGVGAFAGVNDNGSLDSSYATGNVALSGATVSLGAFVGSSLPGATYNACYYDEETTGAAYSSLNDISTGADVNVTAYSTADFALLDFNSGVWKQDNNTYGRPYLAWQNDGSDDYNVSNPAVTPIDGGFSQEATYLGTSSVQGLRYAKIKPLAYDDFSDNAYGWDDGSSTSNWVTNDGYSGFGIASVTDMEYTHSSGIAVLGGDDYLAASATNGAPNSNQSKFVCRELWGLGETFYVSFLARFSSSVTGSWSFIALGKKEEDDDSGVALGTVASGSKIGAAFADDGDKMARMGTSSPIGGQTYFVVGKWTCDAAGNITSIDTWVNPTSPDLEQAEYHNAISGISDQMTSVDIQSFYSGTSNIDEVRVGRTWSSVVPCVSQEMNWIDVTPATSSSGNAFTIEKIGLDKGGYCVQPYILKVNNSREYGDMSCVKVNVQIISTDSVTSITETTAKLYGYISDASDVTEYGFYYSASNVTANLINGSANEVQVYSGIASDFKNVDISSNINGLTNRKGCYFRLYVKDDYGNYYYGKVIRFISEKRDFSLALDGDGDFLLIDKVTTHEVINDWGVSDSTFSVDFWMRNASTGTGKMVLVSDTGTNIDTHQHTGYMIAFKEGKIYFESGGSMNKTTPVIFDQEWHHIACTYKGGEGHEDIANVYIDGSLIRDTSITLRRPSGDVSCKIGCTKDPNIPTKFCFFKGNMDAMHFWNVTLTAEQISELSYDNVKSDPVSNTITCIASGRKIAGLTADNLTASLGFNVMSTQESVGAVSVDIDYPSQDSLHFLPFFHADTRLGSDATSFNIVAVGNAHPSAYLPRVSWRYNAANSDWMTSSNWGGYAYPGEGTLLDSFPDVDALAIANDSAYCLYTLVDSSAISPVVTGTPPEVQVLVDMNDSIGTYRVDEAVSSKLTIIKGIASRMFDAAVVDSKGGSIVIEEGSMEVFQE